VSGAAAAADALKEAARAAYLACFEAGSRLAKAQVEQRKATDVVEVMRAMVEMIVAAADLHDAAEHAEKSLRAALTQTMDETGCTSIQSEFHGVHLARKPAYVSISDEAAVPAEYVEMRRYVDKRKIAAAIKDGADFPWASLLVPNEQTLVLRARKE
jgi:predicted DNA-binding protein (UPF0278 family)